MSMKTKNTVSKLIRDQLIEYRSSMIWFTSIIIIIISVIVSVAHHYNVLGTMVVIDGNPDTISTPLRIYLFVLGTMVTSMGLAKYVQAGVSRRNFFLANTVAFLIYSFGISYVLFAAELIVSSALGISMAPLALATEALTSSLFGMIFYFSGWLIGLIIYAFGARWWLPAVIAGGAVFIITEIIFYGLMTISFGFTLLALVLILLGVIVLMKRLTARIAIKM